MADLGDREEEAEIIKLLKAQQEAIAKSEEKDQKVMEAMLKFQKDSEQRHQELLVSVLGKIGDIFAAKKIDLSLWVVSTNFYSLLLLY